MVNKRPQRSSMHDESVAVGTVSTALMPGLRRGQDQLDAGRQHQHDLELPGMVRVTV